MKNNNSLMSTSIGSPRWNSRQISPLAAFIITSIPALEQLIGE